MRSKSILAGAVNVPIEPTSNVDSRTTNNIIIKNYSSENLKEKEPISYGPVKELKSVNLNTASNANANSEVKLEYPPPLEPIISREAPVQMTIEVDFWSNIRANGLDDEPGIKI